ncbi:hypothetical protein V6N11_034177 [Hibiscus sabdariffa]|uniref:Uncharacterized protein n=1 Tax=Hibiscus sabdariffa TaxID=183260 RepID=A0ABR2S1R4_9ROSI
MPLSSHPHSLQLHGGCTTELAKGSGIRDRRLCNETAVETFESAIGVYRSGSDTAKSITRPVAESEGHDSRLSCR